MFSITRNVIQEHNERMEHILINEVANTCICSTWENETRRDLKKEGNQARFLNENFLNCLSTLNNTEKRATPTPRIREVIQLSTFGHDFTFFSKLLVPTVLVIQQGSYLIVCFWIWYFILFKPHVTNNSGYSCTCLHPCDLCCISHFFKKI